MVKLFSKNFNLCDHNSPTLQTDGQTTCDRNTALCTKVHRAVKIEDTDGRTDGRGATHNVAPREVRITSLQCNLPDSQNVKVSSKIIRGFRERVLVASR